MGVDFASAAGDWIGGLFWDRTGLDWNKVRLNIMKSRSIIKGMVFVFILAVVFVGGCENFGRDACNCQVAEQASVFVKDLRCEYLSNPLGLDVMEPRLSWKLEAVDKNGRGQRQTAYRILVASTAEKLADDKGDLWDSGKVTSNQSAHVEYGGKALGSGDECYWKVKVKDEKGIWSTWSEAARWTMGLLQESDWLAKWIGSDLLFERKQGWPPPDNTVPDPWLRKTFELDEKPVSAKVYVASFGYHELYVNGKRIGDAVLSPAVANHRKRARYVTYDVAEYLQKGKNVIGLWLGVSWSIFPHYKTADKPQTPIVIAQAEISLPGGGHQRVVTDGSWKVHASPNTLLGVWDFMHYGGELYDARKEVPGWCSMDLDDSQWKAATVYLPKLMLSAEMVEPNRKIKRIDPVAVEEVSSGVYRVDLGVNMNGWLEADVSGEQGQEIEFKFSEDPKKDMTHRLHSKYIIGAEGKGTFCNRFNYFSGRWVQVEGLKYKPELDQIRAYLVRTDYERAGKFECSNELLNKIYDTTMWTYENLSLGGYVVDCPQRERMGYGGDGHATTEAGLDNYKLGAFYTKWSQDWRDVQGGDSRWGTGDKKEGSDDRNDPSILGNLPYTAPTFWGGGGPAWSGFCITLPWEIYEQYGDVRILEINFDTIQKWLAFLETKTKDDMLVRWGGEWDFLGDWLWPGAKGVNGDTVETLFFNNCYWIYNLQTAARIAGVLGKDDVADKYNMRAEQVRRAVHAKFYNVEEHGYVNNFQAYLAVALLVDLPPEDVRPAVMKRFEDEILVHRKGHFWGGITGGYFVVKALLELDRPDLMFEMANKEDYPGWGDMLNKGATTIWESWAGDNSLLHSSYLHIGAWYIEGLGGIRIDPEHPGMQRFIIQPAVLDELSLNWVRASYESLYGQIVSEWRIKGGKLKVIVAVPANCSARLLLPVSDVSSITEKGLALSEVRGLKTFKNRPNQAALDLKPGRYEFDIIR